MWVQDNRRIVETGFVNVTADTDTDSEQSTFDRSVNLSRKAGLSLAGVKENQFQVFRSVRR